MFSDKQLLDDTFEGRTTDRSDVHQLGELMRKRTVEESRRPIAYTLIETGKLNGVDPQSWLTDVLADAEQKKGIIF